MGPGCEFNYGCGLPASTGFKNENMHKIVGQKGRYFCQCFSALSDTMHVLTRSSSLTAATNLVLKSFNIKRIRSADATFYRLLL